MTLDFRRSSTRFTSKSVITIPWQDLVSVSNFDFFCPEPLSGFPPEWFTPSETRQAVQTVEDLFELVGAMNHFEDEQAVNVIEGTAKKMIRQIKYDDTSSWSNRVSYEEMKDKFNRLSPHEVETRLRIMVE